MRLLIVEDEVKMASLIRRGLREGGAGGRRGDHGRERALDGSGHRLRRHRAGRDAPRDRRLRNLPAAARRELLGGPIALLLASLAGYGVAAAALRPVEAMRLQASEIGDTELGRRLPMPHAEDEISRLGETLNAMLGRLETAFERERTFVSDASHELRTLRWPS